LKPPLNEKPWVKVFESAPEMFCDRFWLWFLIT